MTHTQKPFPEQSSIDCAIIGAGPAGLAAALQAKRQGLCVALFEKARPGGQALAACLIENLPMLSAPLSGRELMRGWTLQVQAQGISIIPEQVTSASHRDGAFHLRTDTRHVQSSALIIACGLAPKQLSIPGAADLWQECLFPAIDPTTVPHRGKQVVILGSGDAAFDQALHFSAQAGSVTIVMRGSRSRCIPLLEERALQAGIQITRSRETMAMHRCPDGVALTFSDGSEAHADLVIACIGKEPCTDFLDPSLQMQDLKGLLWAGDCKRNRFRHIAIAAGDGVLAAMQAAQLVMRRKERQGP